MIFAKCPRIYGEASLLAGQPSVKTYYDVVLDHWSLYDRTRRIIPDSGFYQGVPSFASVGGPPITPYDIRRLHVRIPDEDFFWLGRIHPHFGHFLVSTLARAWALAAGASKNARIAYIGPPPSSLFQIGFIRGCLTGLGITQERMVAVSGPAIFSRITVAAPAFIENFSVSAAYFDMLRSIARAFCGAELFRKGKIDDPVYVSKEKVKHGNKTIVNEQELTEKLRSYGIAIASPETLTFQEQLSFWGRHQTMFGFASSAFHMAAFFGGKRLCTISHERPAGSNQVLLDLVSGNEGLYVYPTSCLTRMGKTENFRAASLITDTQRMAADIMRLVEEYGCARKIKPQQLALEPRTLNQTASNNDPFGVNIALRGKATQSSVYPINEGYHREADGAISGRLTGHYQCHTKQEDQPWWQVELPGLSAIYEIRVFNRCDNAEAQKRMSRLRILCSNDGIAWETLAERNETQPVGGLRGRPYRWLVEQQKSARFVRIQLPAVTFLHLDQVEVFGEPLEAVWLE
jgi:hypothetical protein